MNLVLRNGFPVSRMFRAGSYDQPLERLMDSMLEGFLTPRESQGFTTASPRMNVIENDQGFVVQADIPGVAKEDIKLSVDSRRVSIEGEVKREMTPKEGENLLHSERVISKFSRSFTLPSEVDENRADAKLENGVLTLTLPKKEPAQPKKITVQ